VHITDHDLERYHLCMVEEPELTTLEEHILGCAACAERTEQSAAWVDAIQSAAAMMNVKYAIHKHQDEQWLRMK
jgi:hypothetical protein